MKAPHLPAPRPVLWPLRPGAHLHITEALGRDLAQLIDIHVKVETIGTEGAIIAKHVLGTSMVRLENEFEPRDGGTRYVTRLTLGDTTALGRLALNRMARTRAFPPAKLAAWIRHHVEEIGNLDNFLPGLFRDRADQEP